MMLMVMVLVVVDPIGDDNHGELPATDISHCIDAQIGSFRFRSQLPNYWHRSITDANMLNEKTKFSSM